MDGLHINPPTPGEISAVEQTYAKASELLDIMIKDVCTDIPMIVENLGLADSSAVFQYVLSFVHHKHRTEPALSVPHTAALLAAAVTRLARTARGEDIDMSQFESEGEQNK